jgi:hypothetical protein
MVQENEGEEKRERERERESSQKWLKPMERH